MKIWVPVYIEHEKIGWICIPMAYLLKNVSRLLIGQMAVSDWLVPP